MAQELEQDVLLTSEEGSDKMKVVSGVDDKGNLKTVDAKQQNEADFFKFEKNSNMVESFLSNYFAQAKNPKHTGIYLVAASGIESIAGVIGNLLKSGGEEGEEFLKDYKIDTSKFQQGKTQSEDAAPSEEQTIKPTQTPPTQEKKSYQLDADKIDWDMFAKIGITRESLEKSGALDQMLNYRRSSELHPITMNVDGLAISTDARLSLRRTDDDRVIPVIHAVRKEPQLDRPYYGNTFTEEDKKNLLATGNLGRTIELDFKGSDKKITSFVSIDSKTNELVAYNAKNIRIPNEIKGVKLDEQQRISLSEGHSLYLEGMKSKTGKEFNAHIQVNAAERGLTFRFDEQRQQQSNTQTQSQSQDGVRIPNKLGGVELKQEDREALKAGKVVYIEGLTDKQGAKYNAYVKVNEEKGKLDFYKWDPRKNQEHSTKQDAKVVNNWGIPVPISKTELTPEQMKLVAEGQMALKINIDGKSDETGQEVFLKLNKGNYEFYKENGGERLLIYPMANEMQHLKSLLNATHPEQQQRDPKEYIERNTLSMDQYKAVVSGERVQVKELIDFNGKEYNANIRMGANSDKWWISDKSLKDDVKQEQQQSRGRKM